MLRNVLEAPPSSPPLGQANDVLHIAATYLGMRYAPKAGPYDQRSLLFHSGRGPHRTI